MRGILGLGKRSSRDAVEAGVLTALAEPAAICDPSGRVLLANPAFLAVRAGDTGRLSQGHGLFAAFRAAARGARGEGALTCAGVDIPAVLIALDAGRILIRLGAGSLPASSDSAGAAAAVFEGPFAAALIDGADPFSGAIREANAGLPRLLGRPLATGETLADLVEPASRAEAEAGLAAGRVGPFELRLACRPGAVANLYLTRRAGADGSEAQLVHLLDVTEQTAVQLQLAQRNKMEAVGQLAGGVAHDFNNLLTAIRLRAEDLLSRHPLGDPAYDSLSEIRETVGRAAEVVRQLLTFSRKATVHRDTLDLGEALSDFEVLLRRLLREDVRLVTDYGRDIPAVRVDRGLLENAVMNLVVNARDAIRAGGGSLIRLSARRVSPREAGDLGLIEPVRGDLALIEVEDDGPGMTAEVARSIFDPFFTTKPVGEGTGLGLATVYGAVKQAEGWTTVDSAPGRGARLRIFLPAFVAPPTLQPPAPPPAPRTASRDLSGQGLILLVEDEDLVRGITARLLRARGYQVLEAEDGEAALELAREHAGKINLMISDVVMPGMDGPALLAAAKPFLSDAPVLFISGYAEAEFSELLEGEPQVSFLPKPLDIKTLAEQVKRRLQEARGDA